MSENVIRIKKIYSQIDSLIKRIKDNHRLSSTKSKYVGGGNEEEECGADGTYGYELGGTMVPCI